MYVATVTGVPPVAPKVIVMPVAPPSATVTSIFPCASGLPFLIVLTLLPFSATKASIASSTVALLAPAICLP